MLDKAIQITKKYKWIIVTILILIVSGVPHAYNMFNYPYYENDEGVYMSQAWSLITQGELAPYTYWYDHAPGGWILIALWTKISGGFFTFGTSIDSGRVLMLILHLIMAVLIYKISKRITGGSLAGIISVFFFSFSPLAIFFQRRVLLDNIMIFWVIVSLAILFLKKLKLRHVAASALCFGFAILSKENAIFFIPPFLALLYLKSHKQNRSFALAQWLIIMGSVTFVYFLYALLKGEFFPTNTLLGGDAPHVSILETLGYQFSRPGGSPFDGNSSFWINMRIWLKDDRLLLISGIFNTTIIFLISIFKLIPTLKSIVQNKLHKQKLNTTFSNKAIYFPISLFSIFFWFFLSRGGLVIEFYIIPLIPFIAIINGLMVYEIVNFVKRNTTKPVYARLVMFLLIISIVGYYFHYGQSNRNQNIYTSDQTKSQIEAIDWIRNNFDNDYMFVIDNYGYVDLNHQDNPGNITFPNTEWYWKVGKDSEIREEMLKNDPANIGGLAVTPQMNGDIIQQGYPLIVDALHNARIANSFWSDGWGVEIWLTQYPDQILKRTWKSYKRNFISEGRTIDTSRESITTSEGQSYTLLRAVWMDDKKQFDKSWQWTEENLLNSLNLFAWIWGEKDDGTFGKIDNGSASDADQDIALALSFAYKRWGDDKYLEDAKKIIEAIWDNEVATIRDTPYLIPGTWAKKEDFIVINPSYLSPYSYRIFSEIDDKHDWTKLIDSTYDVYWSCTINKLDKNDSSLLLPDWCSLNNKGQFGVSEIEGLNSTNYSYDAFRSTWRIALDYKWNGEKRAKDYLLYSDFIRKEWEKNQRIVTAYTHDGEKSEDYESVAAYSANIGNFIVVQSSEVENIYTQKIYSKFYEDENDSYWDDPDNYYTQNWGWFGTALYSNNLPNLWVTNSPDKNIL